MRLNTTEYSLIFEAYRRNYANQVKMIINLIEMFLTFSQNYPTIELICTCIPYISPIS